MFHKETMVKMMQEKIICSWWRINFDPKVWGGKSQNHEKLEIM